MKIFLNSNIDIKRNLQKKTFSFTCFFLLTLIPISAMAKLTIATFNIRNFDYDPRYEIHTNKSYLKKMITEMDADIISVQEIVQDRDFIHYINKNFPKYDVHLSECGGQNDQKLGFLYNANRFKIIKWKEDLRLSISKPGQTPRCYNGSRPAIIVKFYDKYTKQTFTAFSVHLKSGGEPNSIKKRFFQISKLTDIIDEHRAKGEKNFIVMGDFNTTEYIQKKNEHKKFLSYMENANLDDLSQKISCTSYWWGGKDDEKQYPTILDHIVVSDFLAKKTKTVKTLAHCRAMNCSVTRESKFGTSFNEVSDHCPMVAEFK